MNPFKILGSIIKHIIEDFKTLFWILKRLAQGKPIVDREKGEEFMQEIKGYSFKGYFRDNWMWLLVIAFAICVGWLFAAKYYQIECNNYIVENYINPSIRQASDNAFIDGWDTSQWSINNS